MNRPPRKKKIRKSDLSRDPRFDQRDIEKAPDLARQDDRNLVDVDDAFKDADVEDKVWLFWQRNGKSILAGGVIALAVVLGIQSYELYQKGQSEQLQKDYQALGSDVAALTAFGEAHPDHRLGAFALLQAADEKYQASDYAAAQSLYEKAMAGLLNTPFGARAELGAAMSNIKAGNTEAGGNALQRIADDATVLGAIRGEAAFNAALLDIEQKNFAAADQQLKAIANIPQADIWAQRAEILRESVPELSTEAKAGASPTEAES